MEQTAEKPWVAMWSLVIGFFMILLDTTIVTVALPHMQHELNASLSAVIWVTSAYLLAYAVPLLITGRLGDRFGQKQMYLLGMVVFTLSSLWCGLSTNVEMLIVARVVQGIGASIMTPQTMSIITLMFPPHKRGVAMSVWGAAAGIASLVGPIAGGLLVDGPGWTWIFFINIPIGVVGTYLAVRNIPHFPSKQHNFDWLGVVLSAIGLFLMVFGIQEGSTYDWGIITESLWGTGIPVSVWGMIIAGIIVFTLFIVWQAVNRKEPLVPLGLFKDRNFSVSNIAIAAMGAHTLTMAFPTTIYFQQVRGMSPTQAALMTAPLALFSGALSPVIGKRLGTSNPKWYAVSGFALLVVGFVVLRALMTADQPLALLLIPFAILGIGNSMIWGPLAVTATRNLPVKDVVSTRLLLEGPAARAAANAPDSPERDLALENAREHLREMDLPQVSNERFHFCDTRFHYELSKLGGNIVLDTVIDSLHMATISYVQEAVPLLRDWDSVKQTLQDQHRGIYEAISTRDEDAAYERVCEHIKWFYSLSDRARDQQRERQAQVMDADALPHQVVLHEEHLA